MDKKFPEKSKVKVKRKLIAPKAKSALPRNAIESSLSKNDLDVRGKRSFDDSHVRWTGYLTITNNKHLRDLLSKGHIPSLTRFINEAVEEQLNKNFNLNSKTERVR